METADIAAVQAQLAGPLPPPLLELWAQTAGGRLHYDLRLTMDGQEEAISWIELFFNGSDGYRDLQGWIEHERELAMEQAELDEKEWDGKLSYLPFGGFEYCDRIYVTVKAGAQYGHILAWKQGLPPAWTHALHNDGIATVAPDLAAAFAALRLHQDPLAPTGDYFAGQSLLDYIDERVEQHALASALADKLIDFYRTAIVDWRTPLAQGRLALQPSLASIALSHAIGSDDAALIAQLAAADIALDQPVQGSALATETAMGDQAFSALHALIGAGAPVAPTILNNIDSAVPADLIQTLLAHGAIPTASAIAQCIACGATDSAQVIALAYAQQHDDLATAYDAAKRSLLAELEPSLSKVRQGKLGHYLGEQGLAARIDHLQKNIPGLSL